MNTPYGRVINTGTPEDPNFGGSAAAVAYARALHDARRAVMVAVDHERCAKQAAKALEELLQH